MNKNINKVLKADLILKVEELEEKLTLARSIYKKQRQENITLNEQLFDRQKEINNLRAQRYPKHNTSANIHETIQKSNTNLTELTPEDDTKPGYANDGLMTQKQAKLYCDLWAKYDGIQMPKSKITREEARLELKYLMSLRTSGELKLRDKAYRPEQVLERYTKKYINITIEPNFTPEDIKA